MRGGRANRPLLCPRPQVLSHNPAATRTRGRAPHGRIQRRSRLRHRMGRGSQHRLAHRLTVMGEGAPHQQFRDCLVVGAVGCVCD